MHRDDQSTDYYRELASFQTNLNSWQIVSFLSSVCLWDPKLTNTSCHTMERWFEEIFYLISHDSSRKEHTDCFYCSLAFEKKIIEMP